MFRKSFVRLLFILLLALLLGVPASSRATTPPSLHLKGASAEAFFDVLSGHGVVSTQVYLAITEGRPAASAAPARGRVLLALFSAAYPTSDPIPSIDAVGATVLREGAFVVDHALNEARLVTPLRVYDRVSQTWLDLAVDLTWRATGSRAAIGDRSPVETIAFDVARKLHGEGRPAMATGVLRHPDGFDFLHLCAFGGPCEPVPSRSAQLMLLKHGQVRLIQNAY